MHQPLQRLELGHGPENTLMATRWTKTVFAIYIVVVAVNQADAAPYIYGGGERRPCLILLST